MMIKPIIRDNIALNADPEGCLKNIQNQIKEVHDLDPMTAKPLNVLVIGASSGYGLATRVAFAFNTKSYTYGVSYERAPRGKSTGSAGYYNNIAFQKLADEAGIGHDDLNGDCFSHEAKQHVINAFKDSNRKIDVVVYSVASGLRIDPDTGEKIVSTLKPIGQVFEGYTVDIAKAALKLERLEPANEEEIKNTTRVMGGEDYVLWMQALSEAGVLNEGCKAVTYTYIGSIHSYPIYKDGTIGAAKRDIEAKNKTIQSLLDAVGGKAIISASKTVVTKASVFIPSVPMYASALFKVMKQAGTHESIIKHKYRLFKDMVFGDKPTLDEQGLYRLDAYELDPNIQSKVGELLSGVTDENFSDLVDFEAFKTEFLNINGFEVQ